VRAGKLVEPCFLYYPQFRKDLNGLIGAGIMKYFGGNNYSWEREKTSLALYFLWIGNDASCVSGGFWAPIENAFTVKGKPIMPNALSRLASKKRNNARQPESDDFRDIQDIVIQYRKLYERYEQAMPLLKGMGNFLTDAVRYNPDTVPETLEEIMQYVTDISHILSCPVEKKITI
jgi:hypothetical protein